jgi:hypothetical protein
MTTELVHANYPHTVGYLFDCAACESACHCDNRPGTEACVYCQSADSAAEVDHAALLTAHGVPVLCVGDVVSYMIVGARMTRTVTEANLAPFTWLASEPAFGFRIERHAQ